MGPLAVFDELRNIPTNPFHAVLRCEGSSASPHVASSRHPAPSRRHGFMLCDDCVGGGRRGGGRAEAELQPPLGRRRHHLEPVRRSLRPTDCFHDGKGEGRADQRHRGQLRRARRVGPHARRHRPERHARSGHRRVRRQSQAHRRSHAAHRGGRTCFRSATKPNAKTHVSQTPHSVRCPRQLAPRLDRRRGADFRPAQAGRRRRSVEPQGIKRSRLLVSL